MNESLVREPFHILSSQDGKKAQVGAWFGAVLKRTCDVGININCTYHIINII
jgi:hypothetical protein